MTRSRRTACTVGVLTLTLAALCLIFAGRYFTGLFGQSADHAATRPSAPAPWTADQLGDLAGAIRSAEREGLRPADYKLDAIEAAVTVRQPPNKISDLANEAALALAHDYAAGRISNRHRFNWYIDFAGPETAVLARQITTARLRGTLREWLASLLPTNPAYLTLRQALAQEANVDEQRRDRIIANMERWRWLPREFGQGDQLYVNLPTYQLEVITGGRITATYKAVIGATDMPTPVLSAAVRQVIANPSWIVPASIVRRSNMRPGSTRYIFSRSPDGKVRVRQRPGPDNALGRVKIEFPNHFAIYFHDTPSRSLFAANVRAFSHGCVRVQNIDALARSIVAQPDRFDIALTTAKSRSLAPSRTWHANIVYLTLVPDVRGTLEYVGDPYHMDQPLAAALQGRKARQAVHVPVPKAGKRVAPPSGVAVVKTDSSGIDASQLGVSNGVQLPSPIVSSGGQSTVLSTGEQPKTQAP